MKNEDYFNIQARPEEIKVKSIRGGGLTILSKSITYAFQMVSTIILARLLTPEDFGLVAMITVFSNIIIEFGTMRLADAVIQRKSVTHEQISTLFWVCVALCSVIACLFALVAPVLAWFYQEQRLANIGIVVSTGFVFTGFASLHMALLQRKMQYVRYEANHIITVAISDIMAIAIAIAGFGYWALVGRRVANPILLAIGSWFACKWRPGKPGSLIAVMPMIMFGLNSLGNYATNYITRSADKLLIGKFRGSVALGLYDKAYTLFVLPVNQISAPLTNIAVTSLSKLVNEPNKFRQSYFSAIEILAFIGMWLSVCLTIAGKDIIVFLLGAKWIKAGEIFTIFGPAIGMMLIYGTHGWLHLAQGNADKWFRWGIIAAATSVVFFSVGIQYGEACVAAAYSTLYFALLVPAMNYAGKSINISASHVLKCIWKYVFAEFLAISVGWYVLTLENSISHLYHSQVIIVRILLAILLGSMNYLIMLIVLFNGLYPLRKAHSVVRLIVKM